MAFVNQHVLIGILYLATALMISWTQALTCYQCEYKEIKYNASTNWTKYAGHERCWDSNLTQTNPNVTLGQSKGKLYCYLFNARGLEELGQWRILVKRDIIDERRTNLRGECETDADNELIGVRCYCTTPLCNYLNETGSKWTKIHKPSSSTPILVRSFSASVSFTTTLLLSRFYCHYQ